MNVKQLREHLEKIEEHGFGDCLVSVVVANGKPALHCAVVEVEASRGLGHWPAVRIRVVAERVSDDCPSMESNND